MLPCHQQQCLVRPFLLLLLLLPRIQLQRRLLFLLQVKVACCTPPCVWPFVGAEHVKQVGS
jgi:hypothetical protein